MRYRLIGSCLLVLAALAALCARAHAHDPGMSIVTLSEHDGELAFHVVAADVDLPAQRRAAAAPCHAQGVLALWIDAQPLELEASCRAAEPGHTAFEGRIALERSGQLAISIPLLRELARGHETFVRLLDSAGNARAQRMLAGPDRQPLARVTGSAPTSAASWLWRTLAVVVLATLVLALDAARKRSRRVAQA
ncbi:MAG TPA: hypothetical protein VK509_06635 [Polyangiales bacterium]|nr:hypothetical protein [Polyangiales bacterium]